MSITTIVVMAAILGPAVLFFRLHSLPERLGHKKLQFELVAVLGLLSLLTHVHAFWVAGLLLALIDLPDFTTPLKRIAASLETRSGTSEQEAKATLAPVSLPAKDKLVLCSLFTIVPDYLFRRYHSFSLATNWS